MKNNRDMFQDAARDFIENVLGMEIVEDARGKGMAYTFVARNATYMHFIRAQMPTRACFSAEPLGGKRMMRKMRAQAAQWCLDAGLVDDGATLMATDIFLDEMEFTSTSNHRAILRMFGGRYEPGCDVDIPKADSLLESEMLSMARNAGDELPLGFVEQYGGFPVFTGCQSRVAC